MSTYNTDDTIHVVVEGFKVAISKTIWLFSSLHLLLWKLLYTNTAVPEGLV